MDCHHHNRRHQELHRHSHPDPHLDRQGHHSFDPRYRQLCQFAGVDQGVAVITVPTILSVAIAIIIGVQWIWTGVGVGVGVGIRVGVGVCIGIRVGVRFAYVLAFFVKAIATG